VVVAGLSKPTCTRGKLEICSTPGEGCGVWYVKLYGGGEGRGEEEGEVGERGEGGEP